MRYLIAFLLMSSQAFATDWSDLEVGKTYNLTQSFQLKSDNKPSSVVDIVKGQQAEMKALIPLSIPGASLALFIFDYKSCPSSELTTEQELISVEETNPASQVGVMLDTNCELNVYLELSEYYSKSLFTE